MTEQEIRELVLAGMPGAEVEVGGDGYHIELRVVSHDFDGMSRVKRQQLVYGILSEAIRSGAVHAVNIRALTPRENAQSSLGPAGS